VRHDSEFPARAYAACEALARSHYENFPVASLLLPRAMRPHVAAVYAFARVADDIADEGDVPAIERRGRLAAWRRRLHAASDGGGAEPSEHEDLIIAAAAHSIRVLDLPIALFDDLVSAFEQDTQVTRYQSWDDVFDYCRRSANPVGRLVLRIAGYRGADVETPSDALCTALQLANFWQDFGRDWRAGRLYVPLETAAEFGAQESDLNGPSLTPAWSAALGECARMTRDRFDAGRSVCDRVRGRLRFELRLTWLGGCRILERADARRRDLLSYRPVLGAADLPALVWAALRWPRI
jgi:phytoene synthase